MSCAQTSKTLDYLKYYDDPTVMARVDSGHETFFSDDSPCDLGNSPSSGLGSSSSGHTNSHRESDPPPPTCPPKITPFSGVLSKGKVVIRPIAFKPVGMSPAARLSNAGERYGSTPILTRPGSHLTLYGSSNDLRHQHGNSNYSLDRKLMGSTNSMNSSPPLPLSSLPVMVSGRKLVGYDSMDNIHKSPMSSSLHMPNHNNRGGSMMDLTPSPSDSGVTELEAALRDRDSELAYLRQTMEHNEQVIFRVYQEKEKAWERELRRQKALQESRLRSSAQKAMKLEQMLMMQTYQLQQEKKRLKEEAESSTREATELRQEVEILRTRLEETEWGICQKTGEISLLKAQLKDSQGEQTTKGQELLQLRTHVKELTVEMKQCKEEMASSKEEISHLKSDNVRLSSDLQEATTIIEKLHDDKNQEISRLKKEYERLQENLEESQGECKNKTEEIDKYKEEIEEMKKDIEEYKRKQMEENSVNQSDIKKLQNEVKRLQKELEEERIEFESQLVTWAKEKEKVLLYQRQLQLNYVQMFRRSRALEAEVESLTMELELGTKSNKIKATGKKQLPAIEMGHTIEL